MGLQSRHQPHKTANPAGRARSDNEFSDLTSSMICSQRSSFGASGPPKAVFSQCLRHVRLDLKNHYTLSPDIRRPVRSQAFFAFMAGHHGAFSSISLRTVLVRDVVISRSFSGVSTRLNACPFIYRPGYDEYIGFWCAPPLPCATCGQFFGASFLAKGCR